MDFKYLHQITKVFSFLGSNCFIIISLSLYFPKIFAQLDEERQIQFAGTRYLSAHSSPSLEFDSYLTIQVSLKLNEVRRHHR